VSTAAPPLTAGGPGGAPPPESIAEPCPLCGASLRPDQEWCLKCGAAARTRLAAAPNWKGPLITVAVICALALGVLAAALVKLAGDSGPAPAARTTTVTSALPATGATPTSALGTTATTPTVGQPATTSTATAPAGSTTTTTAPTTTTTNKRRSTRNRRKIHLKVSPSR
jgi:hypothetical protein